MTQYRHELYRNLLDSLKIESDEDILWGKVLHSRIWECIDNNLFQSMICVIKSILIDTYQLEVNQSNNKVLLIRHCNNRQDYNTIWRNIKSCIDEFDIIEVNRNRRLDTKVFKNIRSIFKVIKSMPKQIEFKDRLYLSSWVLRILRLKKYDLSIFENMKLSVFFFDGDPIENFLCQKIKSVVPKCITTTLQHGQYIYKKNDYDINQTGILNFTADYIFAWGEFTEKQFIKAGVDKHRIIKSGNILNVIQGNNKPIKKVSNKYVFGVICDAPSYDFAHGKNNEMIELAIKLADMFDFKFWVKLHPFDSEKKYNSNIKTNKFIGFYPKDKLISDLSKEIDFAILHASSSYVDLLMLDCKSFKYNSEIHYPLVDDDRDTFNDFKDLAKKIGLWNQKNDEEKLNCLSNNRNRYNEPGNTIQRYKILIDEMIS